MRKKTDTAAIFVPEAEQPHRIPGNWRWVNIGAVADLYTGNSINEKVKKQKYEGNPEGYLYISTKDIGFDGVINYETNIRIPERDSFKVAPPDTALLCIEGGSAGRKIGFVNQAVCFVNKLCAFRTATVHSKYVFYFLQTHCFESQFLAKKHGLIGGVPIKALSTSIIPIAPLAEQQRIVERIESLFAKLDAAREKAQAVVDGFELRKAAILYRAFTGELTAQWRESNQISDETWRIVELQDVCKSIFDGDHLPPPKSDSGIPFLVISNVNNGYLSFENTRFVPLEYYNSLTETRKPEIGDVLYTLVGSYGIPVAVDSEKPFCFQRHMALLKPTQIDTYYLWYQLQTLNAYHQASEMATGSAQLTVPIKKLRKMKIALSSETEQLQIVKELDYLLGKDQQVRDTAQEIIERIDAMKKAILGRAFRGELGTNDPSEASPDI